jgi:serine/threonine-protein kinase
MEDERKPAAGVSEGDVLAGKYRIDKVLGTGGMGVVVAAHHIQLDEKVAIKFLLPQALASPETVARFAREARAAVKIKSEHVARVSDVGTLESGAPYMVMEYLHGGDLSDWLKQHGALPIEQAIEFVLQACEAIAEAHAIGIVHRDLKPSNLFVTRRADGSMTVKVLDFGISKTTGRDMQMTATSSIMGSPLYMSPEQMQSSKDVDARSDIWSIGIVLYELLTGDSPFQADTMPQLVLGIMSSPPPPLRNKRPEAPAGLEQVILKCLDKDRGRRFQTVGELALALMDFAPKRSKISVERITGVMRAAGLSSASLAMPPSSESDAPAATGTNASWGTTANGIPTGGSKKMIFIGLGLAAVAIVGVVVVVQKGFGGSNEPASTASSTVAAAAEPPPSAASSPVVEPAPPASVAAPEPSTTGATAGPGPTAKPPAVTAVKTGKTGRPEKTPVASQPSAARPPVSHPGQTESPRDSWGGRL